MRKTLGLILISFLFCAPASATRFSDTQSWQQWIEEFREEAINDGIRPGLFDRVFQGIHPNRRVIRLDRSQPERRLTFMKYRNTRIDPYRIKLGKRAYRRNQGILDEIGQAYGVSPCFIVSFWGIESSYGNFLGNFPVIKSLATLAYDGRRGEFFRKELLYALHILNEGHISNSRFKGEWAGASGHPQFLPSSWFKYAVDYDQDGRKDIWTTYDDVFASIANYLVQNGWQSGQPWSVQVDLPRGFDQSLLSLKITKPVHVWQQMGVRIKPGFPMPNPNLQASVIEPYGGPAFMAFKNFKVIMRYNNSTYYAGSVGYLADRICGIRY